MLSFMHQGLGNLMCSLKIKLACLFLVTFWRKLEENATVLLIILVEIFSEKHLELSDMGH